MFQRKMGLEAWILSPASLVISALDLVGGIREIGRFREEEISPWICWLH